MPNIDLLEIGHDLLHALSDDPTRHDVQRTPERWARAMKELTSPEPFQFTVFPADDADEMVIVSGIPFYSLCEHHILPMWGSVTIGYLPDAMLAGLSKLPRTVRYFSRRLQVQERLTRQIADHVQMKLQPKGVGVIIHAQHLCMEMRGADVGGANVYTRTSCLQGVFRSDPVVRQEFFSLIPTPTP